MRIGEIRPAAGSTRKSKRRGKGSASGLGGSAGRGVKGHKARTGGKIPAWFEGGQMPIQRRVPKRGFTNINAVTYQIVKVGHLSAAPAGGVVDRAWLAARRVVRRPGPVKLLAGGELKHAVTVQVDAVSEGARKAVEAAGGRVETPAAKPAPGKLKKKDRTQETKA